MDNQELELKALYYKAIEDYRSPSAEKHDEGFWFLQQVADRGMVEALKLLGVLYTSGQYAPYPAKDAQRAIGYYQQAADAGDEEAMYWLSQCYDMGLGVEKNEEEAARWRQMALDHGFVPSENEEEDADSGAEASAIGGSSLVVDHVEVVSVQDQKEEEASDTGSEKKDPLQGLFSDEPASAGDNKVTKVQQETVTETALVKPKARSYEEKLSDKVAEETRQAAREDRQQRLTYMLIAGGVLLGIGLVVGLITYAILSGLVEKKILTIFWIAVAVLWVALAALGAWYGKRKADAKIEKAKEFRKTPFYESFGGTFGKFSQEESWNYKVYKTLEKLYKPVSARTETEITKKGVGLLYPGWTFATKRSRVRPDFVVLTPKSLYVIKTLGLRGRVMGDLSAYEWTVYRDGGANGAETTEKQENGMEALRDQMTGVRNSIQLLTPLAVETIPVTGVLLVSPETDIKGLRTAGAGNDILVVQGSPDKLRLQMAMRDRDLTPYDIDMEELAKVMDQIGRQQLDE